MPLTQLSGGLGMQGTSITHRLTLRFSVAKYGHFVSLMRRICRSAGHSVQKYAIEISLISVAIAGTGFITEAILAVEYIQATRLALIQAHPGVAFILVLMSLVKCEY